MDAQRQFRKDIHGLRAIAVTAVVLFHFGFAGFSGGFIGVDVFFVISGFLMTGIIYRSLEHNNFSFLHFYVSRIKRVIPAVLLLSLVLVIFGWFFLSPDDYSRTSREIDRALLFVSNNYFFKHSGYFDTASHERYLLHTWSLAVEWQFYIIYPILLALFFKINKRLVVYFITTVLLVSFAISVSKSIYDPNYAFYLLPSRMWELLIGGIVYFLPPVSRSNIGKLLYWLGLACIAVATVFYNADIYWPGVAAVLPTLGAALVIWANHTTPLTNNIFSQKIGEWSYSIYLWHWPFVVLLTNLGLIDNNAFVALAIIASVFFAYVSYVLVENPLRYKLGDFKPWTVVVITLISIALLFGVVEKIRKNKGYPNRVSDEVAEMFSYALDKNTELEDCHAKRININDCIYGTGEVGLILIGDSHAMALSMGVVEAAKQSHVKMLDLTEGACPSINNARARKEGEMCHKLRLEQSALLSHYLGVPVLISNRYSSIFWGFNEGTKGVGKPYIFADDEFVDTYTDNYRKKMYAAFYNTTCQLAQTNPIYLLRPIPEMKQHVPKRMGRSLMYTGKLEHVQILLDEYEQRNKLANHLIDELVENCGVKAIDVKNKLCNKEFCYGDIDDIPMYYDDDHINNHGAMLFVEDIYSIIKNSKP